MKKQWTSACIFLLISALILIPAMGLIQPIGQSQPNPEELGLELSPRDTNAYDPEVYLEPEYAEYAPDAERICFFLVNNSDTGWYYGNTETVLEVHLDGHWYVIPYKPNVGFTLPMYHVAAGQETVRGLWLDGFDYSFHPGRYRLAKGLGTPDTELWVFGEFTLGQASPGSSLCPITEQETSPRKAVDDGVVVLNRNKWENTELIPAFFRKICVQMPCTLRIVEDGVVTDYCYDASYLGGLSVTTWDGSTEETLRYAFLGLAGEELYLSSFSDPADPYYGYIHDWDYYPLEQLCRALSPEDTEAVHSRVQALMEDYRERNATEQLVYSEDGEYSAAIILPNLAGGSEPPLLENWVSISSKTGGTTVDYKDLQGLPLEGVYVKSVEGSTFEVWFRTADGDRIFTLDAADYELPLQAPTTIDTTSLPFA